jgi:P4 family phage/plasmid primase-like protien
MRTKEVFEYEPDKLAERFLGERYIWHPQEDSPPEQYLDGKQADWKIRWWRGGFYEWHKGRYTQVDDGEMSAQVAGFLQDLNRPTFCYEPPDPPIKITQTLVRNILLNVSAIGGVYLPDWRELNNWTDVVMAGGDPSQLLAGAGKAGKITISFLNGLVMFGDSTGEPEFCEHTPKYFSLARLPYNYEKDAKCPKWLEFLDDVMEGDGERVELLQQWSGYLLTNALKHQKFLLIAGEGGNGKTVFTSVLEKMVGEENVSHVPLCCFGDRFALATTLGKMLNSSSESSHGLDELCETMLKSYTSGDRMTFDRKHREPISAHPTAKVMISTNQLPNFADKSNGIWRRMLFVPFDRTIPIDRQNPELVVELAKELPGIFNWAYEGLCKLNKAGRFIEPARCKEAIGEYRRDTNPAQVFLEENYVEGFEFEGIPCGEVYQAYAAWCGQNGYHALNANNFGKEVKRAFRSIVKRHTKQVNRQVWTYSGLAAKEGSEVYSGILVGCDR